MCDCQTPTLKCINAREKINGIYCSLDFPKSGEIEIGKLMFGDKFNFKETPRLVKTVLGQFDDGTHYQKECGWKQTENNLKRIVNKV